MHEEQTHREEHHLVPYAVYGWVWIALVACTTLTVAAKYADLQHLAIFAALLIATVKAGLVLLYFMHVRFEKPVVASHAEWCSRLTVDGTVRGGVTLTALACSRLHAAQAS
ncbi:MAG: cytochrome C oxidase subunit IV family protein [Planctomycetota bacterium]